MQKSICEISGYPYYNVGPCGGVYDLAPVLFRMNIL